MEHLSPIRIDTQMSLQMSGHAAKRGQQRAIRAADIEIALIYGEKQWSHGDFSFLLTDRALQDTPHQKSCDRLRGLCVVVSSDGVVRTVKWNFRLTHRPGVLRRAYLNRHQPRTCWDSEAYNAAPLLRAA